MFEWRVMNSFSLRCCHSNNMSPKRFHILFRCHWIVFVFFCHSNEGSFIFSCHWNDLSLGCLQPLQQEGHPLSISLSGWRFHPEEARRSPWDSVGAFPFCSLSSPDRVGSLHLRSFLRSSSQTPAMRSPLAERMRANLFRGFSTLLTHSPSVFLDGDSSRRSQKISMRLGGSVPFLFSLQPRPGRVTPPSFVLALFQPNSCYALPACRAHES